MINLDEERCRFSKLISASESQIRANIIQPEKMCLQKQLASLTQDEVSLLYYTCIYIVIVIFSLLAGV